MSHSGQESGLSPSAPGGVVLDIGDGIGALVIYCPSGLDGEEIEISQEIEISRDGGLAMRRDQATSRGHAPAAREQACRVHSQVRRRLTGSGVYAAVYPGLPAGCYTIWRDANTPAETVTVRGGEVATCHWT